MLSALPHLWFGSDHPATPRIASLTIQSAVSGHEAQPYLNTTASPITRTLKTVGYKILPIDKVVE